MKNKRCTGERGERERRDTPKTREKLTTNAAETARYVKGRKAERECVQKYSAETGEQCAIQM